MRIHRLPRIFFPLSLLLVLQLTSWADKRPAHAAPLVTTRGADAWRYGVKLSAGGRYDNVRMCIASDPGVKGGPALDLSLFSEFSIGEGKRIGFNLPVLRPVLFATAFKMLQFEPQAGFFFDGPRRGSWQTVMGGTVGLSLHYGPDFRSPRKEAERGPDFFAMGPMVGVYLGAEWQRPERAFNWEFGLQPYVTTLFGIDDPQRHRGVVIGGMLEGRIIFH
jgi:hypothetical protein